MNRPLRIGMIAPVATSVPPPLSGSIETMTALLTDGLVSRGHEVTLFATAQSTTRARLHATFSHGYREDPTLWPWELCELFNLSAAVERAADFDVLHYQAEYYPASLAFGRLTSTPLVQTLHHAPSATEIRLWSTYLDAPFVALSRAQATMMAPLHVVATVHHGLDSAAFPLRVDPDDYLLFLGRFTPGKGVVQAIEVARRSGLPLLLAAKENDYYRDVVAPLVDGVHVRFVGEVGHAEKVALLGGARALLYPLQTAEPFGLVITEAMACGTPVAALDLGAVGELVDDGVTGGIFSTLDEMCAGLSRVLALDRARVRSTAMSRFSVDRMVDGHVAVYEAVRASATAVARDAAR